MELTHRKPQAGLQGEKWGLHPTDRAQYPGILQRSRCHQRFTTQSCSERVPRHQPQLGKEHQQRNRLQCLPTGHRWACEILRGQAHEWRYLTVCMCQSPVLPFLPFTFLPFGRRGCLASPPSAIDISKKNSTYPSQAGAIDINVSKNLLIIIMWYCKDTAFRNHLQSLLVEFANCVVSVFAR